MDSIELLKKLGGKFGKECKIGVTTGDTYSGLYYGAEAFDAEAPLVVKLGISTTEAQRIGVPSDMQVIGIAYDVITDVEI